MPLLSDYKCFSMPDGTRHVNLDNGYPEGDTIVASLRTPQDYMDLMVVVSALESLQDRPKFLDLRYFSGRQDRHTVVGSPFTVAILADLINVLGFLKVRVYEPHSPVTCSRINRSEAVPMTGAACEFWQRLKWKPESTVIVAPDRGAVARAQAVAEEIGLRPKRVLYGNKVRQGGTGTLLSYELSTCEWDGQGMNALVIDDLCDGGATFIPLAQLLMAQGYGWPSLFVAHGIFSRGMKPLQGFAHIGSTNSFSDETFDGRVIRIDSI